MRCGIPRRGMGLIPRGGPADTRVSGTTQQVQGSDKRECHTPYLGSSRMSDSGSPPFSMLQDRWQVVAEAHLITLMLSETPHLHGSENEYITHSP